MLPRAWGRSFTGHRLLDLGTKVDVGHMRCRLTQLLKSDYGIDSADEQQVVVLKVNNPNRDPKRRKKEKDARGDFPAVKPGARFTKYPSQGRYGRHGTQSLGAQLHQQIVEVHRDLFVFLPKLADGEALGRAGRSA